MPTMWRRLWLTALLVFTSSVAFAQNRQAEYLLGPGDNIRVLVFQNPDLTLETRISESGSITFPLIGIVQIGGLTLPAAEQTIARGLSQGKFLENPQVNILLLQTRSNQVSVLGQVNRAGRYPLETATARLSDLLATAGGVAASGEEFAVIVGTRQGKPFRKEVDIARVFAQDSTQEDPVVVGGDVIYVARNAVFYIYGEVQRPGSHRLERGMTVRQALAQGGGPTLRGSERDIRIHRAKGDGQVDDIPGQLDQVIKPNDVIYIRERLL